MSLLERANFHVFLPDSLKQFARKEEVSFTSGPFTVETASTPEEIYEALRLRYKVFYKKFWGRAFPFGLDVTPFDAIADHLLVKHEGKIVGTYRLIASKYGRMYFSLTEFDHGTFGWLSDHKLELSRACIDPTFRQGAVIALLWKGILKYAEMVEAKYLFGCASVGMYERTSNIYADAVRIYYELLDRGSISNEFTVKPTVDYEVPDWDHYNDVSLDILKASSDLTIPPLLESYLRIGSKIVGRPAYDPHFKVIDFFTVLKISDMNQRYLSRLTKI